MSIEGRIALVTGASGRGIGRSTALTLAREGADVIVNYHRNRESAEAVAREIERMGRRALAVQADVSDATAVGAMFDAGRERFERVDIVVNSAGGSWKPQDVTEIAPDHLRGVLAEEIESTYNLLRAALPGMREQRWGRFVSIGGHLAEEWRFGPPDAPLDYPLGKTARHWLTRTLAPFERPHGITINAVAPGPVTYISLEQALDAVAGRRPDIEGNTPQDVAEIVAILCSEAAERITGAVVPVPGNRPI